MEKSNIDTTTMYPFEKSTTTIKGKKVKWIYLQS